MRNLILFLTLYCSLHPGFAQSPGWQEMQFEGEPQERHENGLVAVGDKLILIGGRGEKDIDIYHTKEKKWTKGARPPLEIHHMQVVALDGLVYIAGGFTGGWPYETPLSHVLIYDVTEDVWATGPQIPQDRQRGASGAVVHNNKIYLINGIINGHSSGWVTWLDEFDPYTGTWKQLPDSPHARDHFHAVVINEKIYVAGGRRSGYETNGFGGTVPYTDVFNFRTNTWNSLPDIPTQRAGTFAAMYDNNLVVMGGESDTQVAAHNEVEMLDLATNLWISLPPLMNGRHGTQAVYFDNTIITGAGSGNRGGGPELTSFEIFSTEGAPAFELEPVHKAEILTENTTLDITTNDSRSVSIQNSNGKKAILLPYIQLDSTQDLEIELPRPLPIILAPGEKLEIKVTLKSTSGKRDANFANLLIKPLGEMQPLKIQVRF